MTELAKRIVPRGVTTVVEDPHEFANVLGVKGIKLFFEEAKGLPLRFLLRVPGHVPAMPPEIETSGAEITVEETKELLGCCLLYTSEPGRHLKPLDRAVENKIGLI